MSLRRSLLVVLAAVTVVLAFFGSPANAVDNPDYTSPPPSTVVTSPPDGPETLQRSTQAAASPTAVRSRMAITGQDVTQTVMLGAGLLVVGGIVLVARRRVQVA